MRTSGWRSGSSKYLVERLDYDDIGRAVKKRLWITADVKLLNLDRKRKMIFYEPGIQSFRVFSDLVLPIEPESQVREYVLDDLAGAHHGQDRHGLVHGPDDRYRTEKEIRR